MRTPPTIWIIHREPHHRASLARIAAAGDNTVLGSPTDPLFESATTADTVVLGLSEDFELELDFTHRIRHRLSDCRWILLCEPEDAEEARRLFDTLSVEILPHPPDPGLLRRALGRARRRRYVAPLSRRSRRSLLASRFGRWFGDLEMPDLLGAMDPQLADVPLLILGESGTGRGLLARYVHAFAGGTALGPLRHVACAGATRPDHLLSQLEEPELPGAWTVWLEDVDYLPRPLQQRVQDWIEYGLPEGVPAEVSRWIATARDDAPPPEGGSLGLDPRVCQALSGRVLRLPPLRDRPRGIEPFVADTTLAWCSRRGVRTRRFSSEALQILGEHLWPGNARELEAVVVRTLAATNADPVLPGHLRFEAGSLPPHARAAPAGRPAGPPEPTVEAPARERPEPRQDAPPIPVEPVELEPELESEEELVVELEPEAEAPPAAQAPDSDREAWSRVARAVAHELRNPLVSIRTFAELLPEHYEDEEFRDRFAELVGADVRKIEDVVTRLQDLADPPPGELAPVDVAALLDQLLDERRSQIESRRLLVLKELDRTRPLALADSARLARALGGLLDGALRIVPERGDVYLASKHHAAGPMGEPCVRVLLRYHNPARRAVPGMSPGDTSLEVAMAEATLEAAGGTLTVDTTDSRETVVVIDLRSP